MRASLPPVPEGYIGSEEGTWYPLLVNSENSRSLRTLKWTPEKLLWRHRETLYCRENEALITRTQYRFMEMADFSKPRGQDYSFLGVTKSTAVPMGVN